MARTALSACTMTLSCWAVFAVAEHAQAAGIRPPEPYRLVFTSSTPCRDPGDFTRQLESRTTHLRPALGSEPAVTIVVDLGATAELTRGQLVLRSPDGSLTVREVPGVDCQEVLAAMALIVALELEGRPAPPPPTSAPQTPRASFAVGARLVATAGAVPEFAPGFGVFAEVVFPDSGLVTPSLRIAGHRTRSTQEEPESEASEPGETASAEFELLTARFSACPLRWAPNEHFNLRPCALIEFGQLRARGENVVDREPETALLWSAGGLELAAEVLPLGPLTLGAEGAVLVPFVRDGFYFDPEGENELVHRVSRVGFTAAIGAGIRFF
ncbi:MAG TPA: hypothetical protein VIM73_15715 [Polyangiaceae bacterium]